MEFRESGISHAVAFCVALCVMPASHAAPAATITGPAEAAAGTNVTYWVTMSTMEEDGYIAFNSSSLRG